jgi:phosphate:Na+ symporter
VTASKSIFLHTLKSMTLFISILKLAAGIGLFLFAMYLIEQSLKNLSGRNFKLFLQRVTKNRIGAVLGGAVVTGILQSSSMVSIMVLAFVGAGIFSMKNAMAIILGANLGTTLASWIVATLGFKTNIEVLAYPAITIGGFLLAFFSNKKNLKYLSYFLLGFGLLFIALSFMKTSMEAQVMLFDLSTFSDMSVLTFVLIGFIVTLLVQSSSVTMALSLSALHAGAIGFAPAAAIVLGSETGTTIKILLGSIGGTATKKRVALGNFLFNISLTSLVFIFFNPVLHLISDIFNIKDPIIGLVTFSTLINLMAVLLFLPFLNPYIVFLENFFRDTDKMTSAFIGNANINEPETALDLFSRETKYFIHNCMILNMELFEIDTRKTEDHSGYKDINEKRKYISMTPEEKYDFIKHQQGEIQAFYLMLRTKLHDEQYSMINQHISAARSAMYSVKGMKDISTNISNLSRSSKNIKFTFFTHIKNELEDFYTVLISFINKEKITNFEILQNLYNKIDVNYTSALNTFYKEAQLEDIEDIDITIIINFNREVFTSNKAMLMAVKDLLLEEKDALNFNAIPVYKT